MVMMAIEYNIVVEHIGLEHHFIAYEFEFYILAIYFMYAMDNLKLAYIGNLSTLQTLRHGLSRYPQT